MKNPYRKNAGFVLSRIARLGGRIVVYDRKKGCDVDADDRWIVMHEPSSLHVSVDSRKAAFVVMNEVARAYSVRDACIHADILPIPDGARPVKIGDGVFVIGNNDCLPNELLRVDDLTQYAAVLVREPKTTQCWYAEFNTLVWCEEWQSWYWGRGQTLNDIVDAMREAKGKSKL